MDDDPNSTPWCSTMYVEPADRPAAWADMARTLAHDGLTPDEIADRLCVDVPTVAALLGVHLLGPAA
jgi:hypothetical protein